jgi:hypothetical protein
MALTAEQQALDFNPELQDVSRQRKLADLLMSQGMQQPQGQMISGHYVAPSFLQQLNPLANMLAGQAVGSRADTKQAELATALRNRDAADIEEYARLQQVDPAQAIRFGLKSQSPTLKALVAEDLKTVKYGEGEIGQRRNIATGQMETVGRGQDKLYSVDGNLVSAQGNNIFKAPKVFAPHASQLVPVAGGFAEYNPNTKTLLPIGGGQGGAGATSGALMPPLPQHLQTEVSSINQQKSTINDVLKSVEQNRQYFGTKYAAPEILAGELGASKMNQKLPSSAVESRSQVFNTASSVIKERAGTAQSKNESAIIMRFLPSIYDNDKVIIDKLNGFNKYLESKEKGITPVIGAVPAYRPGATQPPAVTTGKNNGLPSGVTQAEWNAMPESDRKLFQ